ncbi:negative regulator of genetic competence MecA [Geomicrobium sp. JCM 19037]|uniref:genetic competence negative regulator n=1 Tax=Geomicrobium sp. JCM 19037 TaxID=1460634 RepID=UPI00045F1814|nr:genetic competence negative regulator [Geomicrobium sp. JCM 19037]GAK02381.1 negative regulator of genetic competence MecA [Geomicrobium sp. JCM 19037]
MRLERIAANKIKVFLTFDDLKERGLTKDDLWLDRPKVHQLFRELILEADVTFGFKVDGALSVEVFSLPAQGMVIHISKNEEDISEEDDMIEMDITVDERRDLFYKFQDFEAVLQLVKQLHRLGVKSGKLLTMQDRYYLYFPSTATRFLGYDRFIAIISEYGDVCAYSHVAVEEHGRQLIETGAVQRLNMVFFNNKPNKQVEKKIDL